MQATATISKTEFWNEDELAAWASAIKQGEVVAAPAEGVYGYCADPFNKDALVKLMETKSRSQNKGFITLIDHTAYLALLCSPLTEEQLHKIYDIWGTNHTEPTTIILPAKSTLPQELTGGRSTIAVRMPSSKYMLEYLDAWGAPLVSTSLNKSGDEPAITANSAPKDMQKLALDAPLSGTPSKIYDLLNDKWLR